MTELAAGRDQNSEPVVTHKPHSPHNSGHSGQEDLWSLHESTWLPYPQAPPNLPAVTPFLSPLPPPPSPTFLPSCPPLPPRSPKLLGSLDKRRPSTCLQTGDRITAFSS